MSLMIMMSSIPWFDRRFEGPLEIGAFPTIVERLRGTPVRLEEKLGNLERAVLTTRVGDTWSIQENLGHLLDLEPLWLGRIEDLLSGARELRPADLTNRATHEAGHNDAELVRLLEAFRTARSALVDRLDALTEKDAVREALHPRLKTPMRTVDLCRFVAEHDDHHLARMTMLARSIGGAAGRREG
jgi:uncharacterized damage-inducible protein DinB